MAWNRPPALATTIAQGSRCSSVNARGPQLVLAHVAARAGRRRTTFVDVHQLTTTRTAQDSVRLAQTKALLPDPGVSPKEFTDVRSGAGGVFRGVMNFQARLHRNSQGITGHDYVIGVDWGKHRTISPCWQ